MSDFWWVVTKCEGKQTTDWGMPPQTIVLALNIFEKEVVVLLKKLLVPI